MRLTYPSHLTQRLRCPLSSWFARKKTTPRRSPLCSGHRGWECSRAAKSGGCCAAHRLWLCDCWRSAGSSGWRPRGCELRHNHTPQPHTRTHAFDYTHYSFNFKNVLKRERNRDKTRQDETRDWGPLRPRTRLAPTLHSPLSTLTLTWTDCLPACLLPENATHSRPHPLTHSLTHSLTRPLNRSS